MDSIPLVAITGQVFQEYIGKAAFQETDVLDMTMPVVKHSYLVLTAEDLPLYCPNPRMPLWSAHPRVFLDILKTGEAVCPYCSAHYVFTGERPKGHH